MTAISQAAALLGVAGSAVIYGTDVFCALVLRPAAAGASDTSVADLLGRVHHYGDRRLRTAAARGDVPADTRALQQRWDAVIWPRAALQAIALAGLLVAVLAT